MRIWHLIHRFVLDRAAVAVLALALTALAVAPGGTSEAPCDGTRDARILPAVGIGGATDDETPRPRTGLDLEVRILNLRIEFPWMRALPISPGRHIVIALLSTESGSGQ